MKAIQHIVLLHGWGSDGRIWKNALPFFNAYADTKVIDISYIKEEQLYSIDLVCESIAKQIPENSLLCGWSLGGMLAMQIAARYPTKIKALVTLASNLIFVAREQWPDAMPIETFDHFFSLFETKPQQALKRFMLLEVHGDKNAKSQQSFLRALMEDIDYEHLKNGLQLLKTINNYSCINEVRCPARYCFGENDALVPSAVAKAFKTKCRSEQGVVVIPESGHLLHHPIDKLDVYLSSFLSECCHHHG